MGLYNDKVLYIHIPKCGGISVKEWLRQVYPDMRGDGFPIGHIPLWDVQRFTGRSPDSFEKIVAVIRNPYDQQVSQWKFWRKRAEAGDAHVHNKVAALHDTLTSFLRDRRGDFDVWYDYTNGPCSDQLAAEMFFDSYQPISASTYVHYPGYYHYWVTVGGEVPDNLTVVRMEEMDDVLPKVLGVEDAPPMPHANPTGGSRLPTQTYYTPEAVHIVNQKFKWCFAHDFYPMLTLEPATA